MSPPISARHSIGLKMPLVAAAIILLVGAILSVAAYETARRSALRDAGTRLTMLTTQLGENFRASIAQIEGGVRTMAARPPLAGYLKAAGNTERSAALAALAYDGVQPEQVAAIELRDAAGKPLLSSATGPVAAAVAAAPIPMPADDSAGIGRLMRVGEAVVFPVVARVGRPGLGYLVQWRRMATPAGVLRQLSDIIGTEAELYFGNADGGLWTDLSGRVQAAPTRPADSAAHTYVRSPPRGEVLAAEAAVPGSPWRFSVEFPTRTVVAPAAAFLRKLSLIAVLCVTLGALATWLLSRRLILPLKQITEAANAIAAGDITIRRLNLDSTDELGHLGRSFDTMASEIVDARLRLEEKVASRTRELNATLERLQDTQESLVRREKLALLGHLASAVGHELRNPLGVMSNAVFYLEMVLASAPDNVREYLGILRQQIAMSGKIVNDLLDFSRVNPPRRQPTALAGIATAQLGRLLPLPGITVEQDFPDSLPYAQVDPVHAAQVVLNLLTNAVQAMSEQGGTLSLRGRGNGGDRVLLEVSDTGPGVPPENLERIFEPLFTTKARGIGLGLAVSRSLAQANGGALEVKSEPGRGATFVFAMPTAEPPA